MAKRNLLKLVSKLIKEEIEILGKKGLVPLSKINRTAASAAIKLAGKEDSSVPDDQIESKTILVPVQKLIPSQIELKYGKAFSMAIGNLVKGKWKNLSLNSIISKDFCIMDGHHRWAGVFLIDPSAKIEATQIMLPGPELVTVLNVVTVGAFNRAGNSGSGNIADFTSKNLKPIIDAALTDGIKGDYVYTKEQVAEALGKMPGANGDTQKGMQLMLKNADLLPKEIMKGAPKRIEMPVIDPSVVKKVSNFLARGSFDIKPPYSPQVQKAIGVNELKFTSYGIPELLKTIFNRQHLIPKLGFDNFKAILHHIKFGDQEEQNELISKLKNLGVNMSLAEKKYKK